VRLPKSGARDVIYSLRFLSDSLLWAQDPPRPAPPLTEQG